MVRWTLNVVKVLLSKGTTHSLSPTMVPASVQREPAQGQGWSCCSQGLLTVHSLPDTLFVSPTLCRPSLSPEAILARAARSTSTPRSTHTLR